MYIITAQRLKSLSFKNNFIYFFNLVNSLWYVRTYFCNFLVLFTFFLPDSFSMSVSSGGGGELLRSYADILIGNNDKITWIMLHLLFYCVDGFYRVVQVLLHFRNSNIRFVYLILLITMYLQTNYFSILYFPPFTCKGKLTQ